MGGLIVLFSAPIFLAGVLAHIFVKIKMRPGAGSDLDDYYHEFEDQHPQLAKYEKWSKITLTGTIIGMLGLFLGLILYTGYLF